jgi:glycosyltransferase 2 family protein
VSILQPREIADEYILTDIKGLLYGSKHSRRLKPIRTKNWHKYLIYISFGFLLIGLANANYLKIPRIFSASEMLFSIMMLLIGFIANTIAQQHFLKMHGCFISLSQSISMVGLNIFGKYVPGKMWIALGKAFFISKRTNHKVVDLSILFVRAQFIGIWCGLMFGIIGLLLNDALDYLSWLGFLLFLGLNLVLFSTHVNIFAEKILNKYSRKPVTITTLSLTTTFKVLPWFLSSWVIWGCGFYLMTASITDHTIPISTAFGFPLGATLGILFLLAPGGVGIREGIIVGYLSLMEFSLTESITIATASRLWFLLGEFFIFAAGLICDRFSYTPFGREK